MKQKLIKYPLKLGYDDKSGREENIISDANNETVVAGWGDCCGIGGIRNPAVARAIIKALNEKKPRIYHF